MTTPDVESTASYEQRLAEIAANAAPPLDAATVNRLRDLIAPALQGRVEVGPVVPLPVVGEPIVGEPEAPGVAA
jgi:hypothetical protein